MESMEIYKSKYATIRLMENELIVEQIWHSATADMSRDDFKREQQQIQKVIEQYKPQLFYTDAVNFGFIVDLELQEWNAKNLLSYFSSIGGKKIAIVLTKDIMIELAVNQALNEGDNMGVAFKTRYFENELEAKNWLLE